MRYLDPAGRLPWDMQLCQEPRTWPNGKELQQQVQFPLYRKRKPLNTERHPL